MRTINKREEPTCIAGLRREVEQGRNPGWNLQDCAEPTRNQLKDEQEGLCAYCMNRIKPYGYRRVDGKPNGGMKVEHWIPRSDPERGQANMFVWKNLLGVCGGETLSDGSWVQHCDDSRGNEPLAINPVAGEGVRPEDAFDFRAEPPDAQDGLGIWLHARQAAFATDIRLLNLNASFLARARYDARKSIRKKLSEAAKRGASRDVLKEFLRAATKPGPRGLPPFAPIVETYLRKKLAQWG